MKLEILFKNGEAVYFTEKDLEHKELSIQGITAKLIRCWIKEHGIHCLNDYNAVDLSQIVSVNLISV